MLRLPPFLKNSDYKNLKNVTHGSEALKRIKQILIGKPASGKPLKEFNTGLKTVMPFNISYKVWQDAVEEIGYSRLINYLKRPLNETERDLLTQELPVNE